MSVLVFMNSYKIQNCKVTIKEFVKKFKREILKDFLKNKTNCDVAEYVLFELFNNAFEHGNKKDTTKSIFVVSAVNNNLLTVSIEDEGEGFNVNIPDNPPPLNIPRGRGLWSVRQVVSSLNFNLNGNKVTITFLNKEKMMANNNNLFSVFNGRVIIVRPSDETEIFDLSDKIMELTTMKSFTNNETDLYLFIDLAPFTAVSSSFFGTLGATIQLPYIKQVGLAGMRSGVQKIAKRFGIVDYGLIKDSPTKEIKNNAQKFRIFDSIEKAVLDIVPEL